MKIQHPKQGSVHISTSRSSVSGTMVSPAASNQKPVNSSTMTQSRCGTSTQWSCASTLKAIASVHTLSTVHCWRKVHTVMCGMLRTIVRRKSSMHRTIVRRIRVPRSLCPHTPGIRTPRSLYPQTPTSSWRQGKSCHSSSPTCQLKLS